MRSILRDPDNKPVMAFKHAVDRLVCSAPVGRAVRRLGGGVVRTRGLRIDTRVAEVSDVSRAQLFLGLYEGAEVRMVRKHLRPTGTIVELGTSLGVLSSAAARAAGSGVRLLCVEANPALIDVARRNITMNAPDATVEVVHGAVDYSAPPGAAVNFDRGAQHTGSGITRSGSGSFTAPVVRLSELLEQRNIEDYTLLTDIEGAEAGLLVDDPGALTSCNQVIAEFHATSYKGVQFSAERLRGMLVGLGFRELESYGCVSAMARDR